MNDPAAPASPAPACRRCGACCRWPGDVRLTDADIAALAAFLGMPEADFIDRHTRLARDRRALSLVETPGTTRCEFLEGASRCRVYPARPAQCRDFLRSWRVPGCPALADGGEPTP